jgi:hypothetical protein
MRMRAGTVDRCVVYDTIEYKDGEDGYTPQMSWKKSDGLKVAVKKKSECG